jgi:hypothetical protein
LQWLKTRFEELATKLIQGSGVRSSVIELLAKVRLPTSYSIHQAYEGVPHRGVEDSAIGHEDGIRSLSSLPTVPVQSLSKLAHHLTLRTTIPICIPISRTRAPTPHHAGKHYIFDCPTFQSLCVVAVAQHALAK